MAGTRGRRRSVEGGSPILSVDLGGTGLKAAIVDRGGRLRAGPVRLPTPRPATPAAVMGTLRAACAALDRRFGRVAFGFPGVVEDGVARNAPNLAERPWRGVDVAALVEATLGKPTRVVNDADLQALGILEGRGVEVLVTFGTGIGSGLCVDGRLVANLELGHQPFRDGRTYEEELSLASLERHGRARFRQRARAAVDNWLRLFSPRQLVLGGGNARHLTDLAWPARVRVVEPQAGLRGGAVLWAEEHRPARRTRRATRAR